MFPFHSISLCMSPFHSILISCSFHLALASILFSHLFIGLQPRGTNCLEYGTRGWYTTTTQEPGCGATRRKQDDTVTRLAYQSFLFWNLQPQLYNINLTENNLQGGRFNRRFNTTNWVTTYKGEDLTVDSTQSVLNFHLNQFIKMVGVCIPYSLTYNIVHSCGTAVNTGEYATIKMWNIDTEYSNVNCMGLSSCYFDDHWLTGFHDCGLVGLQWLLFRWQLILSNNLC